MSKSAAAAVAVPGNQISAVVNGKFTLGGADAFEQLLAAIPASKRKDVKDAAAELSHPLMPK